MVATEQRMRYFALNIKPETITPLYVTPESTIMQMDDTTANYGCLLAEVRSQGDAEVQRPFKESQIHSLDKSST